MLLVGMDLDGFSPVRYKFSIADVDTLLWLAKFPYSHIDNLTKTFTEIWM
jgi:hypothetical protein